MNSITLSGGPAIVWTIVFIVVASLPVWLAAKVTGAGYATLPRAAAALLVGTIVAVVAVAVAGPKGLLLAPLGYLLAFKFILDTSLLGAVILGVLALAGYAAMGKMLGGHA